MIAWLSTLAVATCPTLSTDTPTALIVLSADQELLASAEAIQSRLEALLASRSLLVSRDATTAAMTREGGEERRAQTEMRARAQLERAYADFRELDDSAALGAVSEVAASLASVHARPTARRLLARAHLLAAAIFLARGQLDAVSQRLGRVLDLEPKMRASAGEFDPRLGDELAAVRARATTRATGRLVVERASGRRASVFIDGHEVGEAPLVLKAISVGRHLLHHRAPGHRSVNASVLVRPGETIRRSFHLAPDEEVERLERLATELRAGEPREILALLARRAGASIAIAAELVLAPRLTRAGTSTVAVRLFGSNGGRGFAMTPSAASLEAALEDVARCAELPLPRLVAPSLPQRMAPRTSVSDVSEPRAWYESVWVFPVAVGVVLGVVGSLVAARASSGPADSLEITLIPRP